MAECTVVAIAKNEGRYLVEWIAHNMAIGAARVILFDNGSTDGSAAILRPLAKRLDVLRYIPWPAVDGVSSQRAAYNFALPLVETEWVAFIDLDEFLVPWRDGSIGAYLDRAPADVSAVHLNWRCFGSSGLSDDAYPFVTTAFSQAAFHTWANHYHYKTVARTAEIDEAFIHRVTVKSGRRVLSDYRDLGVYNEGTSDRVVYDGIQLNHYQSKTYAEFHRRMQGGDANFDGRHPAVPRDASRERFEQIDRNDEPDTRIAMFREAMLGHAASLDAVVEKGRTGWLSTLRALVGGRDPAPVRPERHTR